MQADVSTPQPKHAEQAGHPLEHSAHATGHPQQVSPPAPQADPALRDLSEKRSYGFKPCSPKKPF